MAPALVIEHVAALNGRGARAEVWDEAGQCYVFVPGLAAPSPPWDRTSYDILIAIPAAYDMAELDAFYLSMPYTYNGGTHQRVENGAVIAVRGRQWRLVSWHYLDGKRWRAGLDTLETHIAHCRGFLLARGVKG